MSVMPGLTRHPVRLMAEGEREGADMDEAVFAELEWNEDD